MLLIFGGLPGVGKTAIAARLARDMQAVHLRIDSIEQAMRNSGATVSGPEAYEVAYAVADDNLKLGLTVVADSVNPLEITRAAWRDVARRAGARYVEIEVVCSDESEHRRRVEMRTADIAGHRLPTWREVIDREYEPWEADIVLDTAGRGIGTCISDLREKLEALTRTRPASREANA